MLVSFLFLNKNTCCGYSLEAPRCFHREIIEIPYLPFQKFSHNHAWANNADPDQTTPKIKYFFTFFISNYTINTKYIWTLHCNPHIMLPSLLDYPFMLLTSTNTMENSVDPDFVLRFYGPVNPMGSFRAQSVYLTTRLLGRLSPLSG